MYLSQLILNPRTRRVHKEIANPYEFHRTLMRSFAADLPEDERVLFRVDIDGRTGIPAILMQSHTSPNWAWLEEPGAREYLLQPPNTKSFTLEFSPGQMLAFRLKANPTVKRQGKRHGLVREEEQLSWLDRKARQGGFKVINVRLARDGSIGGRVRHDGKSHQLTMVSVYFDGLLQVTDPEALWQTVKTGIGSGKGLGFGLLSLSLPYGW